MNIPKIPKLPKGARLSGGRPDEAYRADGTFIMVCTGCGKWRVNYAYGMCQKCYREVYVSDSETIR